MKKTIVGALGACVAVLVLAGFAPAGEAVKQPKYVFLFIGDGTSFPQRNAAEFYRASRAAVPDPEPAILRAQNKIPKDTGITTFAPGTKRLLMNTFPYQGVSTTYSANSLITDSSSSGTAIATGHKTRGMTIGFAGTRYDTFLDRINNQKGSYLAFTGIVGELKEKHPRATVADVLPAIRDFFGLELVAPLTAVVGCLLYVEKTPPAPGRAAAAGFAAGESA